MNPTTGVSVVLFGICALLLWAAQMQVFAGNLVAGVLLFTSAVAFGLAAAALRKA